MKKLITILLALLLVVMMTGCSTEKIPDNDTSSPAVSSDSDSDEDIIPSTPNGGGLTYQYGFKPDGTYGPGWGPSPGVNLF